MYTDISETLKVSKRCLLSSLLIFITIFGNRYADAGKIKDYSSLNVTHPLRSSSSSSQSHLFNATAPHFSTLLHKISFHNQSQSQNIITQLAQQSGTANLHKLLQKLKKLTSSTGGRIVPFNLHNSLNSNATTTGMHVGTKVVSGKLLGVNKIATGIPSYITNNTRLKRQLEGIFHVRGTSATTTTERPTNSPYNVTTTTTTATILPHKKIRYGKPINGSKSVVKKIRNIGHGNEKIHNRATTQLPTKKEIGQTQQNLKSKEDEKISTISNFHSKKSNTRKINDDDDRDGVGDDDDDLKNQGKRNYTVEIVEIARKTVIKEDNNNNNNNKYRPAFRPLINKKPINIISDNTNNNSNSQENNVSKKFGGGFRPTQPRLRIPINFSKPVKVPVSVPTHEPQQINNKVNKIVPSVKYKTASTQNLVTSSTTAHPINNNNVNFNTQSTNKPRREKEQPIEVKVDYQEQQLVHDSVRDVDEADLKDYLDGHSTFGSKGDFKHTVSRNVTGYIPNSQDNTKAAKVKQHGLHKRHHHHHHNPVSRQKISRSNVNQVDMEVAKVKQEKVHTTNLNRNNNDKATVYTATGVPVLDQEDKNIYEYSGNKKKPRHHFPKLPKSTLDALYEQGHPAIAKAPHPLSDPYGGGEAEYNPFRANPLVDEPPLKYDPESDRFYGPPHPTTPDKEKLAQSNRPEPVQIESENDQRQRRQQRQEEKEFQEEEQRHNKADDDVTIPSRFQQRTLDTTPTNDNPPNNDNNDNNNNNQHSYERVYQPPEEDYSNDRAVENVGDQYIKEFGLDKNFESLPVPSADEESFKDLVDPEAFNANQNEERHFEPDGRRSRNNKDDDDDDESESTTPRRSNKGREGGRRRHRDDDYSDNDEDEGVYEGPEDETEFDASYVDALKQFDDEIKKIQDNERNGITTPRNSHTPTSTGEPLVITSPGPAVSYQQQRNAPSPQRHYHEVTTPINQHEQHENEDEVEDERQNQRPVEGRGGRDEEEDDRSGRRGQNEEPQEEEEEAEIPQQQEVRGNKEQENENETPKQEEVAEDDNDGEDDEKLKDESQHVKIKKVREEKKEGLKEDKSGNLDKDISEIEHEFRQPPQPASV